MAFNGSGTFQINTAGQPVVDGTVASASVFNALTADLANGLSTCVTKDGQTTTTAVVPFAAGISVPTSAAGTVYSGTYTPTLTNAVNLTSSAAFTTQYTRIGNVVLVSGAFTIEPTADDTLTTMGISLPVASNFAQLYQCTGIVSAAVDTETFPIVADPVNNRAALTGIARDTANHAVYFQFMYLVI